MKTFKTGKRLRARRSVITGVLLGTLACGGATVALEKPQYEVLESDGALELRRYEPYLVAETFVEASFESAGNEGFQRLADYIFGNNRSRQKLEMTAPVSQSASEKIEMTAPVNMSREGERYRITFMMPSRFTLETLPEPVNPEVQLREVAARTVAAVRYSGRWSSSRYDEYRSELEGWMEARGWQAAGEPILARYDPPWVPWFLRRNEVLIPVESTSDS